MVSLDEIRSKSNDGKDGANGKDGVDGKDGTNGKDGVDGKDGMCAGYFAASGESTSWGPLSFTVNKSNGGLISYNSSSKEITLSKGHSYSLVFSGTVSVIAKNDDAKCGVSLIDGYDSSNSIFYATQTYIIAPKKDQTSRLTVAYNTIYTATDDITLKFQYSNMLFQQTNFGGSRYSITIIALDESLSIRM